MTVGASNWYTNTIDAATTTGVGIRNIPYYDNLMVLWSMSFQPTADIPILTFNFDSLNTPCWWRLVSAASGVSTLTNSQQASNTDLGVRLITTSAVNQTMSGVVFINNVENARGERTMTINGVSSNVGGGTFLSTGVGARKGVNQPIYSISLRGAALQVVSSARLAVFGSNII